MSKLAKAELLLPEDAMRVEKIRALHINVCRSQRSANVYRVLCGAELNAAKATVKHGDFGQWCKDHLPFLSNGSAHRYMQIAEIITAKFPTVGNLSQRLQLTDGQPLPEKEIAPINEALFDALDGKTITEFMRDEGIIRKPKDPNAKPHTRKSVSAEEQVAAERETAISVAHQVIQTMRAARGLGEDEGATLTLLPKSEQDALKAEHALFGKALKKFCRRSRRSTDATGDKRGKAKGKAK